MSSKQHTPGPWFNAYEQYGDYIVYVKRPDEDHEPGICSCDGSTYTPLDDEDEIAANAALITAAPDLLKALKDCFPLPCLHMDDLGNCCGVNWTCGNCQRNEIAKVAIARTEVW